MGIVVSNIKELMYMKEGIKINLKPHISVFKTETGEIKLYLSAGISNIRIKKYMEHLKQENFDLGIYEKILYDIEIKGESVAATQRYFYFILGNNGGFFEFIDAPHNILSHFIELVLYSPSNVFDEKRIYHLAKGKIESYIKWLNFPRKITDIIVVFSYEVFPELQYNIDNKVKKEILQNLQLILQKLQKYIGENIKFTIAVQKIDRLKILTRTNPTKYGNSIIWKTPFGKHSLTFYNLTDLKPLNPKIVTYDELLNFKLNNKK